MSRRQRVLAERVVAGCAVPEAVLGVLDDLYEVGGAIVPIGRLEAVGRREVDVEGVVEQLWEPSHSAIQQVGLLADDSGRVKVTVWAKSDQPWMAVGERVRVRCAAKSWYNGRVSVSLTSRSTVVFPRATVDDSPNRRSPFFARFEDPSMRHLFRRGDDGRAGSV